VSYLLDTNVVSEWVKPRPDAQVVRWLAEADEDALYLSVVTLAELRHGVALLPEGDRRDRLAEWLAADLPARFEGRLLLIDADIGLQWGDLMANTRKSGVGLSAMDGFIAATAIMHRLTLVTRNTGDFAPLGVDLLNPWLQPPLSAGAVSREVTPAAPRCSGARSRSPAAPGAAAARPPP
jgi:toxin FitB